MVIDFRDTDLELRGIEIQTKHKRYQAALVKVRGGEGGPEMPLAKCRQRQSLGGTYTYHSAFMG